MKLKNIKKKKGAISLVFVIMCLTAIIVLSGIFTVYQHQLIVRNFEAAADLAAVQAVRQVIDEESLRNETLEIKPDKLNAMRASFLKKIRENMPSNTYEIIRIEIPTIAEDGTIDFGSGDIYTMEFPNSESANFSAISAPIVDYATGVSRTSYFVGGNSSDNCAMELAKVTGNLATSGTKEKESYILTSKVTIFFRTTSYINQLSTSMLNYVNILSGNERQIITKQIDQNIVAVTIQTIGQVVMR